jgi:large subunit ribosomal protein L3
MPTRKSPRKGSLQFWPRKRANRFLPSVNWRAIDSKNKKDSDEKRGLKGFIGYKAGMSSISVRDNTPNSLTNKKTIIVPVTIIATPTIKIFSVRFLKDHKVVGEYIVSKGLDKELRKKLKLPKSNAKKDVDDFKAEDYDDISVIVYSQVKKTGLKKKPDLIEVGLSGEKEEKLTFVKENLEKEIKVSDIFDKGELVDFRGLTKGFGFTGPVKRFGIKLKRKKSEKGQRRPGSLGPWHPARVTFRAPQAGQYGMFSRLVYNNKIVDLGDKEKAEKMLKGLKHFGDIKTDYIIVRGSVQGPAKRQVLITRALRPTKKLIKKDFEMLRIMK